MRGRSNDPYDDDPHPVDEDDPELLNELFETFKIGGDKPEIFTDLKFRAKYAAWLKAHENDKEED